MLASNANDAQRSALPVRRQQSGPFRHTGSDSLNWRSRSSRDSCHAVELCVTGKSSTDIPKHSEIFSVELRPSGPGAHTADSTANGHAAVHDQRLSLDLVAQ